MNIDDIENWARDERRERRRYLMSRIAHYAIWTALGLAIMYFMSGCATTYKTAVLLTEAEDSAMKVWAAAHNNHQTTAEFDLKVMAAHARFNEAKAVALVALKAYKAGGDKNAYIMALEAARAAVGPLLDLLLPVLSPNQYQTLRTSVSLATHP